MPVAQRHDLIGAVDGAPSITRQCQLLGVSRSGWYYEPAQESAENLELMALIDRQYIKTPFFGVPRMTHWLREQQDRRVNHKRVARLMRVMGLQAIYPKPRTTVSAPEHKVYPYLLRDVHVVRPDQVWATDITYIPMRTGFMYLVAVIDWYSRYVLAWELSNIMTVDFCLKALEDALTRARPEIFNSDQGSQFTCLDFVNRLLTAGVQISMDGRGRALDNVFVERLWRSLKYEDIYLRDYTCGRTLFHGLERYFAFFNHERPHQGLGYKTPAAVYHGHASASH
jgi:putative transposase